MYRVLIYTLMIQELTSFLAYVYIYIHTKHNTQREIYTINEKVLYTTRNPQAADVISISKLKNTKSTGHDEINLQHIKESLMVAIPYITLIIITSIVTMVFPKPASTLL